MSTFARVQQIVADVYNLPIESVTAETSLYALEESLDFVELTMRIENDFGHEISDDPTEIFATPEWTVGDLVKHLDDRLNDCG